MFVVRVYVAPSPIHGLGCFAAEPIHQGQLVWQFDPRLDLRIPLAEFDNFPPATQEFLKRLTYVEQIQGVDYMVLCADQAKFVNHSNSPNLIDSPDGTLEWAAQDIAADEELTCNYYASDQQAAEKLGAHPALE
jgi:SET domain-containing protein